MVRVALVTGGSRGIGAATVRTFAKNGYDVAFTYLNDQKAAHIVVKDSEKEGVRVLALQANASDFARAKDVISSVIRLLGGLNVLVCNAGIAVKQNLQEMTQESWESVIDVSLSGAFYYIRHASTHFCAQQDGKIVCVGSINAARGRPGTVSYNAAKAGLEGLVRTAAAELGPYNINVNLVAPGFVETKRSEEYPPGRKEEILESCAIKRLGQPEDIAPVIAFLCSEEARHITGCVLSVDAGQSLSSPLQS